MNIDEAAADIIETYSETPEHLTGPALVNWIPLIEDGSMSEGMLYRHLGKHPLRPMAVARTHNARARKLRAAALKAVAEKFAVHRVAVVSPRVSSAHGAPAPTWDEAWTMVADELGRGAWHRQADVIDALRRVGKTSIRYHIGCEAYPDWVEAQCRPRGVKQIDRRFR